MVDQRKASFTYRPRICLVVPEFPKLSETFIVSKFLGLINQDWDVHLVCTTSQAQVWKYFPHMQTPAVRQRVHPIWPISPRWLAWLLIPAAVLRCFFSKPTLTWRYLVRGWHLFGWRTAWQLYQDAELICLEPDILHFEFGAPAAQRIYLKELLNCKIVVSFRGYDLNFSGLDQEAYYQAVWEQADALHLLGEDLWLRAQRRGCPPDKAHVLIPPAIDFTAFSPATEKQDSEQLGSQERPLRILSVGRLEWKKGYEFALQAVKLLQDQGLHVQYRILGGGDYLEALAFARHQLGLKEVVEFLGAQPHQEVQRQMSWADVFLHAAISEGFGNAVLEAQAMQLPVVCSDADGLSENVSHGVSGFVTPRRDPQAMADKLALLARNPELREQMGQAGRLRVLEHFQLEQQLSAFENLYQTVLSQN